MDDESIKRRILGLMAKTAENGCTEAEALAAAEMVQKLLHDYQLDLSDIKIKESKCTQSTYEAQQKSDPMVCKVLTAIAFFTDTKVWLSRDDHGWRTFEFFGLEHDVLIAEYITKICDWAIIWGGEDFKATDAWKTATKSRRVRLKQDYQYGMACRLAQRLRKMKEDQIFADKKTTGRDLVVVKSAVVESEFEKLELSLTSHRSRQRNVDPGAYAAGAAAGDRVALNPGVGANGPNPQIN